MKISLDSAALCDRNNRYGNYVFSQNLIEAIKRMDKINQYTLYSFCKRPPELSISDNMHYKRILPKKLWLSARVGIEEILQPKDIFFALNQAVPFFLKSRVFSFSHGLSYYFFKDLYQGSYEILKDQLFTIMDKSEYVFVSSKKVKKEMSSIFLKSGKVIAIPYGIPYDMLTRNYRNEIISDKVKSLAKKYFLYVGMDHPIKNIQFLVDAFKIFVQSPYFKDFRLILVGSEFDEYTNQHPNILSIERVNRDELKYLFQKAQGYLSASRYESFNLPILEALSQDCPVVAIPSAVIPELTKYVQTAQYVEEFVENMKIFAGNKARKISKKTLLKEFSWDGYLSKLLSLYQKT